MKNKNSAVLTAVITVIIAITLLFAFNLSEKSSVIPSEQEVSQTAKTHSSENKNEAMAEDDALAEKTPTAQNKEEKAYKMEEDIKQVSEEKQKTSSISKDEIIDVTVEEEKNDDGKKAGELTCTLSIRCDTLLDNIDSLNKEKRELVPKNGIIFPETTVIFYEGESVFNILKRETKKNKIHMEFVNTPAYNSTYIEGIANLYEFDCGELSGWMYKVNGIFPNYGCSKYTLRQGDKVEWVYTCDLGADVGGNYKKQVNKDE